MVVLSSMDAFDAPTKPWRGWNTKLFDLTWQEVMTGVKNIYVRIGTCFPLLGNNKTKLNYRKYMLMLAVQAAVRLHNFIMNTEKWAYAAFESPEMHFSEHY